MGRPLKKNTKARVNITLNPSVWKDAGDYAYRNDTSASALIEELLSELIATEGHALDPEKEAEKITAASMRKLVARARARADKMRAGQRASPGNADPA